MSIVAALLVAPLPAGVAQQPVFVPVDTPPPASPDQVYSPHGLAAANPWDQRFPMAVYDNTAGPFYAAPDPTPGGAPPLNGVLEGVRLCSAGTWAPGEVLTGVTTAYRKPAPGPVQFLVVVRFFNTVDTSVADPGSINQSQFGPVLVYGPVTSPSPAGNFALNLAMPVPGPGQVAPPDDSFAIDIKYVDPSATPDDYLNPQFLSTAVTANVFASVGGTATAPNPPAIGCAYPAGTGVWADQDAASHQPPLVRNGDYQAAEHVSLAPSDPDSTNLYLRILADVPCASSPPNDACADAQPISPPGPGGATTVSGTTICAAADLDAPYCAGPSSALPGVWYSYLGQGRRVVASTCSGAHPAFPGSISVFTGSCADGLDCVNANGVAGFGTQRCPANLFAAEVEFCAVAGVRYFIQIRSTEAAAGPFDMTLADSGSACVESCGVQPPPGATIESDCRDGVCRWMPLPLCQPVAGRVDADASGVDADVYVVTVPAGQLGFTLRFSAEFPALLTLNPEADPQQACDDVVVWSGLQFSLAACGEHAIPVAAPAGQRETIVVSTPSLTRPQSCGQAGSRYVVWAEPLDEPCAVAVVDCFTRGPAGAPGACGGPVHDRPHRGSMFIAGGADALGDDQECVADWDGDGCIMPTDVAAFVTAFVAAQQTPGSTDADIDCDGVSGPADVARFINLWFQATAAGGC